MHLKRTKIPKTWPIPRKGKGRRFVAVPSNAVSKGITLLIVLRDLLKLARTRKEAKHILSTGKIEVNHVVRKDEKFPLQVFDILSLEKGKTNYRLEIENRKFVLKSVSQKEAETKIIKIIGKKMQKGAKIQMNLDDGQNILFNKKFSVGDSAILNLKTKKVGEILPLKKGATVEIIKGKHAGKKGEIKEIQEKARKRYYLIKLKEGAVTLPLESILVIK